VKFVGNNFHIAYILLREFFGDSSRNQEEFQKKPRRTCE
jgi:hypothetical protein